MVSKIGFVVKHESLNSYSFRSRSNGCVLVWLTRTELETLPAWCVHHAGCFEKDGVFFTSFRDAKELAKEWAQAEVQRQEAMRTLSPSQFRQWLKGTK